MKYYINVGDVIVPDIFFTTNAALYGNELRLLNSIMESSRSNI